MSNVHPISSLEFDTGTPEAGRGSGVMTPQDFAVMRKQTDEEKDNRSITVTPPPY